jgi:hypothetical protein
MPSDFSAIPAILAFIAGSPMASAVDVDPLQPVPALAGSDPSNPIDVSLPPELQGNDFHSLPIAGLVVTPDAIAERVLLNPRLRATVSQPFSGMGAAYPIPESSAVSTHADPSD